MKHIVLILTALTIMVSGCKSARNAAPESSPSVPVQQLEANAQAPANTMAPNTKYIPKAVIFKTNGDWRDNVYINLDPAGEPNGYPDPRDITANSAPLPMAEGFLLDRRGGICPTTVFLTYTWAEYASLPEVPTSEQLKAAIIPEAHVIEVCTIDMPVYKAISEPTKVDTDIRNGNYKVDFRATK